MAAALAFIIYLIIWKNLSKLFVEIEFFCASQNYLLLSWNGNKNVFVEMKITLRCKPRGIYYLHAFLKLPARKRIQSDTLNEFFTAFLSFVNTDCLISSISPAVLSSSSLSLPPSTLSSSNFLPGSLTVVNISAPIITPGIPLR